MGRVTHLPVTSPIVPVILLVGLLGACSEPNPAGPSAGLPSGSTTGATITGSLQGSPVSAASDVGDRGVAAEATGTTVHVVGTSLSTSVNGQGRFTLNPVPEGTQQLEFKGPGVGGTVTVHDVKTGDSIEVSISLNGTTVALESERRSSGSEEQVEGRVEALPASPAGSLVVAGRAVLTNGETRVVRRGATAAFSDLQVGQRVHVKGHASGSALLAALIDIQNTNVDLPVNVNGTVTAFGGSSSAFTFVVDGRDVRGDEETEFFGGSRFADLGNGVRVEVKGLQRDGFVYADRIHVNRDGEDAGDADDDEVDGEFSGTLSSFSGTTPPITLVVDGRTVVANAGSELQRRGDRVTFDVLRVGMRLDVSASASGGTLVARKLTIAESTYDVDVDGAVNGSVIGSCPTLSFAVGSLALKTTSYTEFRKTSCSAISTDDSVKVRAVLLPGGTSAEVTRVEVK